MFGCPHSLLLPTGSLTADEASASSLASLVIRQLLTLNPGCPVGLVDWDAWEIACMFFRQCTTFCYRGLTRPIFNHIECTCVCFSGWRLNRQCQVVLGSLLVVFRNSCLCHRASHRLLIQHCLYTSLTLSLNHIECSSRILVVEDLSGVFRVKLNLVALNLVISFHRAPWVQTSRPVRQVQRWFMNGSYSISLTT